MRPFDRARTLPGMIALSLLLLFGGRARAIEVGLDAGAPVWAGTIKPAWDAVASTGVPWVRINFRVDDWSSVGDSTPRGPDKLGWMQAYDKIVDAYLARGIQVYGLLNDELLQSPGNLNSDAFVSAFVQSAVQVIDHFKDRIRVFEIINEPNDWAGGSTARVSAQTFAKILQQTYVAVKQSHASDPCWQVRLVSGPLFSFDGTTGADYLAATYAAGKQLGWGAVRSATGSYPLDGIGYHVYVAQGENDSLDAVKAAFQANLDAVWSVVAAEEGAGTGKRIWVTEYGFRANLAGAQGQADRLEAAFQQMKAHGKVEVAFYFQLQDFPDNQWGVFSEGGLDAAHRRPAADRLLALAQANRPAHAAHVLSIKAPTLQTGKAGDVQLVVENRGSSTWGEGWRLGAGPGCPSSTVANAIAWEPSPGYVKGTTDARLYLPAPVAPGGKAALSVRVRAPAQPGKLRFAARMVQEGVTWFGTTAVAEVSVLTTPVAGSDGGPLASDGSSPREAGSPVEGGASADGSLPSLQGSSGCGCMTAGAGGGGKSALLLLALVVLAWRRRRAR